MDLFTIHSVQKRNRPGPRLQSFHTFNEHNFTKYVGLSPTSFQLMKLVGELEVQGNNNLNPVILANVTPRSA